MGVGSAAGAGLGLAPGVATLVLDLPVGVGCRDVAGVVSRTLGVVALGVVGVGVVALRRLEDEGQA